MTTRSKSACGSDAGSLVPRASRPRVFSKRRRGRDARGTGQSSLPAELGDRLAAGGEDRDRPAGEVGDRDLGVDAQVLVDRREEVAGRVPAVFHVLAELVGGADDAAG